MGKQWKQWETVIFLGFKITADGDCSHEIKSCLFLGRKVMINLGSILKDRDITLPTKVSLLKAIVFPVVMYGFQFSPSVMSDSLGPHEFQHARPPCLSPTPRVHANSYPSSWWCHPAILSFVIPFSSCPQSLPASGSFPMSQLFAWGGQSIGDSASASVLPMNTQDWFPLGWTGWISFQSKDSQESSPTPQFKSINSSVFSFLHSPTFTSIHDHWKNHSLD